MGVLKITRVDFCIIIIYIDKFNILHFPYKYVTYTVFVVNWLDDIFVINYYSTMFRLQLLTIFRELAAYVSNYVGEILTKRCLNIIQIIIKPNYKYNLIIFRHII